MPPSTSSPRWTSGSAIVFYLAGAKLLIHLLTANRYGIFRDELYYLACAEHLDWGYVDQPPLIALIAWFARHVYGDSLLGLRLLPAVAGAALVWMTGTVAREMGGGRFAQATAALAVLCSPMFLVFHHWLTMNAFEPLIWLGAAWFVLRAINTGDAKCWLWFGVLIGVGLETKYTVVFFAFGIALGLLLTKQRAFLKSKWLWLGALAAFVIFLPNLIWLVKHNFPFLELMHNIRESGRDVTRSPLAFIIDQAVIMNPALFPLWAGGLAWLFIGKPGEKGNGETGEKEELGKGKGVKGNGREKDDSVFERLPFPHSPVPPFSSSPRSPFPRLPRAPLFPRSPVPLFPGYPVFGWAYLVMLAAFIVLKSKNYYLAPYYPILFAGGGIAFEQLTSRFPVPRSPFSLASFLPPYPLPVFFRLIYIALILISGVVLAPLSLPILSPEAFIRYQNNLGIEPPKAEHQNTGPLPQHFADEFGWEDMTREVAKVYYSLTPEERERTAIFCNSYGQAGAIDFFGAKYGLPKAISNHQNYWYWGPRDYDGSIVIVLGSDGDGDREHFATVEEKGRTYHPYSRRDEHFPVLLCRGLNQHLHTLWPRIKKWN